MFRLLPLSVLVLASPAWLVAEVTTGPVAGASVLILPFQSPGGAEQWMGRGVQQDLLTDLAQGTTVRVMAPADLPAASDSAAAQDVARKEGASIVIFGQVQQAGTELRLSGQVLDASTGQPLGNLKATGPSADLFHLEDALSGQVLAAVPKSILSQRVLQAQQQPPTADSTAAPSNAIAPAPLGTSTYPQPQPDGYQYAPASTYSEYQPAPTYSYNYYSVAPDYGYTYASPYIVPAYTYGCPQIDLFPFCGSFGFVGGFFFGDRFHHDEHGRFGGHREFDGHLAFHNEAGKFGGGTHGNAFVAGRTPATARQFPGVASRSALPGSGFSRSRSSYSGASRSFSPSFRSMPSGRATPSAPSFGGFHAGGFHGSSGFHGGGGGRAVGGHH